MNPSRTLPQAAHLVFTALRKSLLLAALFPLLAVAQPVDIVNEGFRAGPLPAGWTQASTSFQSGGGGYLQFTGNTGVLTSPVVDLSGYIDVTLEFAVAKFGAAADGPITVEVSNDGGATWTAQTFNSPTPTSSNYMTSGPTAITATGAQVRFRFTAANSPSDKRFRDLVIQGTPGAVSTDTEVSFTSSSSSAAENAGSINLALAITNPDATNATTVTIGASGATGRLTGYSTTVIFPGGSSADEAVVVTLDDNALCDGAEDVTFSITGISGGQGTPSVGSNNTHVLTITDDESPVDPVATAATGIDADEFTANWAVVPGATDYFLDVSTSPTFGSGGPGASTTETFTGVGGGSGSSYSTRSWTGVDGVGWTAYNARTDQVVFTGNEAITLRDAAGAYLESDAIADGITSIRFDVKQVFTGSGGVLTVRVLSGAGFATSTTVGTIAYTTTASVFDEVFTEITGPIKIRVDNNTSARPAIDNLAFTRASTMVPDLLPGYDNLPVAGTSQAVTGLDPLTTYYYRVRSAGGCSTGNNSNAIDVTTTAGASPTLTAGTLADFGTLCEGASSAPQSFTLDGFNLTAADVTVGALAGYAYSTTEAGTYTATLSIPQGGGSFTQDIWVVFTPAAAGNHDGDIAVGGGGATGITVAVTGSGIDTPSEVTTGTASQTGDDSAEAFGSIDVEGCFATTAYGIEYSTTQGFTPGTGTQVAASNLSGGGFSSALSGLDLCTDYYFRAYLTNAQGTLYGAEESFLNTDISAPVATAATGTGVDAFTANWDAVPGATGYFLDVSTSPTFGTPLSNSTFTTGFDQGRANLPAGWSHSGLGTDYGSDGGVATPSLKFDDSNDQLVSATFAGPATSISFWYKGQSTSGSASTLLTEGYNGSTWETIGQLTGIASSATGTETYTLDQGDGYVQFRFTYTKVTGNLAFDDFSVNYLSGNPDFLPGYEAFPVTGTSHEVAGLDPGTTYYYRVRANSGCGTSLNSDVISTTTLVPGCTDPLAENYDPGAVPDNGSCTYCDPVFTYNTPTPTPITIGSGIPDQHMAVGSDCHNFQIGMTAYERYVPGGIIPVGNVYTTTVGYSPTSPGNPTPDPNNARWNFLVSIDLGTYDFTEVNVFLDMDFDPGATPVFQEVDISALAAAQGQQNTSVQQQAQNLKSAFWSLLFPGVSFDATVPGLYDLRVRLESPTTGAELMSHTIQVEVLAPGCTDPLADNYSSEASTDDGSCIYCPPTITYDTPTPTPIVIGSGIPDQHMAVSQDCRGIDVALNAFERYAGELIPTGNVYTTTVGNSPTSGGDPTPDPVLARWNLLGSVDLGSYDFTQVNVFLDLDFDPGAVPVWQSMNLSQAMIDNGMGSLHVYQASENLAAPFWTIAFPGVTFDPHVAGIYDVRVRLESVHSSEELVSMAIQVVVEDPEVTYYSQASGDVSDPIWDVVPVGTPGPATFTASTSMVVQGTHAVVNSTSTEVEDLAVETGGSLTLGAGSSLQVHGSEARFDGALAAADLSTLGLLGSEATILESNGGDLDLWNLTVNTPEGTVTDATLRVRGTLQLDGGAFDATLADVTLSSSATGTGRLGPVASGASYAGDLTVERYIPAGATNWRLLGSPVAGRTVADWDDDFITAGFPGSNYPNFDSPVGSGILWPSVRYYDETESGANLNDGLLGVTGMSQELTPGQGFAVWCGNALNGTGAFTIDVKGEPTIARTPFTLPMSFTDNGAAAADGLNLVSNPLPSAIAFTNIARGADVKNSYQVYDPATGSTALWDGALGTSVPAGALNGIIQSGQAFWLEAEGPAVTTTVNENSKVSVNEGGLFGGDLEPVIPIVRLTISGTTGNWSDQAAILFQDGLPTLDGGDAVKVDFSHPNAPRIATRTADGHDLILNRFGAYSTSVSIPVTVRVPANGSYTITTDMSGLQGLSCFTLVDLHTGTTTPLSDGAEYSFSMNGTANVVADRFVLQASAPVHYAVSDALCGGTATGAVAVQLTESTDLLTLGNAFGEPVQQATNVAAGEYIFNGLEAGNYTVSILSNTACGTLSGSVLIAQPFELGSTVEVVESTCGTEADGRLEVSVQGGVAPYSYEWNNGSTEAFITGAAGSYYTTVIDAVGCTMFVAHDIPSGSVPEALFESSATTVLVNEPVAFTNHSTTGTDLLWNFGDGTTSTDLNATHSYALPGVYTVVLTANNGICEASVSQDINVQLSTSVTATPASLVLNVWSAADQLVVEYSFDHGHAVLVDVLDATGRLHIQKQFVGTPGRVSIPAASLGTGVWFVRVTSGKVQQTFRVPVLR